MNARLLQAPILTFAFLAACGGTPTDPPPPPPPPPPAPVVTSLTFTTPSPTLVPGQGQEIAVVARDGAGAVMNTPSLTWSSTNTAVLSVSAGQVTAVGPGAAGVTVQAGAVSATLPVTVNEGGMALPAGGTITALGGDVEVTLPAGAVAAPTPLTIRRATVLPPDGRPVAGTAVIVEPVVTFAQPATVRLRYPATLGAAVVETQLRLARSASPWVESPVRPVDRTNRRVSGVVAGTGTWAVFEPPPSLRGLAQARGIQIGAAVRAYALREDPAYADLVAREAGSLTPEYEMKFFPLRPNPTTWAWANVDTIVGFALAQGQQVHGHTMLWHNSQSWYLTEGTPTREFLMGELRTFITEVMTRYKGKIASYDVANEVLHPTGRLRSTFWVTIAGPEIIDSAFVWARRADPDAKLYLNDFNVEVINAKSDSLLAYALAARARGIPIDGIGLQGHFELPGGATQPAPTAAQLEANIRRFADAGFDVRITEFNVRLPDGSATLNQQADAYDAALQACLAVSRCVAVTTWGISDKYSHVPDSHPGMGRSLPFDLNMQPKPARERWMTRLGGGM